ncbi:HAD-IC family P-type ATPase [candidate division WWE3 bacterium]|uniref:HAD-IC family P-type ATPase n=1 Tax=candidate division WWE3 bacterium TaxID=2053526 RepID=A0A955EAU0_UNCKA|nr:HAD-IC family P-type ATPase [candidate division WWE3 bacterium]
MPHKTVQIPLIKALSVNKSARLDDLVKKHRGLTNSEVISLTKTYGTNALPEAPTPSSFQIFIRQFASPLVYVLLVALLVTLFLGEFADATIIAAALILNTFLGFIQESRAGHALKALKQMLQPEVSVIRGGHVKSISTQDLVPSDIVILNTGDKIPADCLVIESSRFYVTEAILTGESVPVPKPVDASVFMGTVVSSGNAVVSVKSIGSNTEIGKIARHVQDVGDDTPLKKQLSKFSTVLSKIVLALTLFVFVLGLLFRHDPGEIFLTAVALAVSAIPEGLLVALTVILAIGMQRVLRRQGLVRNLVSAETLGSVTTICTDKTGTLTQGKMQVVDYVGDSSSLALQTYLANDMDDPMLVAASNWAVNHLNNVEGLSDEFLRLDSLPFSSSTQYFASLHKFSKDTNVIFINGAPEVILELCKMPSREQQGILDTINTLSNKGYRLIAYAQKPKKLDNLSLNPQEIVKGNFNWVGILAFSDPIRPDVKNSLQIVQQAGIRLLVITGDYAQTAVSVLTELGIEIEPKNVLLGSDIAKKTPKQLQSLIANNRSTMLFARTKPEQKLQVITALKDMGEVIAMMGDGVNDAPALAKSDIGIVVGDATDVAKETADLVLLDSSFSTIVAAIEEGRGIFDNIRKVILYLLADSFQAIVAILLALISSVPVVASASHILWVNLVSDGFPSLALTVDPKSPNIMSRSPRDPHKQLISTWMLKLIVLVSLLSGFGTFALFLLAYNATSNLAIARSVAFASLGIISLTYVFSIKNFHTSFWRENPFNNWWLNISVTVGLFLQLVPFVSPPIGKFLNVVPIGFYWLYVLLLGLVIFFVVEITKHFLATQVD